MIFNYSNVFWMTFLSGRAIGTREADKRKLVVYAPFGK
jgi:hypothetical protein